MSTPRRPRRPCTPRSGGAFSSRRSRTRIGQMTREAQWRTRYRTAALDLIELLLAWQHPKRDQLNAGDTGHDNRSNGPDAKSEDLPSRESPGVRRLCFSGIVVNHGMSEGDRDSVGEQKREGAHGISGDDLSATDLSELDRVRFRARFGRGK